MVEDEEAVDPRAALGLTRHREGRFRLEAVLGQGQADAHERRPYPFIPGLFDACRMRTPVAQTGSAAGAAGAVAVGRQASASRARAAAPMAPARSPSRAATTGMGGRWAAAC